MQSSRTKDICYFPESESLHHQKYSIFHLTPSTFNSINQLNTLTKDTSKKCLSETTVTAHIPLTYIVRILISPHSVWVICYPIILRVEKRPGRQRISISIWKWSRSVNPAKHTTGNFWPPGFVLGKWTMNTILDKRKSSYLVGEDIVRSLFISL